MKTISKFLVGTGLAAALAFGVWSPLQASDTVDGVEMTPAEMAACCTDVKEQRKKLTDEVKGQDTRLTEQVAEMNRASGDKKLDLLAGVVTLIAEQRVALDGRHATTRDAMMKHMMQHMHSGKGSMADCPMMKGASDATEGANK